MRVGEILYRNGFLSEEDFVSALADQHIAGKRLCSLLIVRGVLEPDQAARALAEQFGVSAALTRHLDNRDRSVEKLLPAHIARKHYALPLGSLRDGEIVICVRDPKPQMQAAFERILQKPVLITVAAAHTLEPLIDIAYPQAAVPFTRPATAPIAPPATTPVTPDFGVRFARPSSQPATVPAPPSPQSFAAGTVRTAPAAAMAPVGFIEDEAEVSVDVDVDLDDGMTPIPETLSLVDLDDAGVEKDFTQHDTRTPTTLPPGFGVQPRQPTLPPQNVIRTGSGSGIKKP